MIVTIGNTKGGVGKTTSALQLALDRAQADRDVLMVDGHRQGSTQMAVAVRADAGRMPGMACVQYHDGAVLRAQVQLQASRYHDVLIDAAGRDSSALRAALYISDLLIVPFQRRSVDVWALADIAALVDEANEIRVGLRVLAVLSVADPGTSSDSTEAAAALSDVPQLVLLNAPIRRRKAFANAVGLGLSVEELTPRDPKACEGLANLASIVFSDAFTIKIAESAMK